MILNGIINTYDLRNQQDFAITYKRFIKLSKIKKYKYVDITDFLFDDDNHPDTRTWMDVEGIEYGWIWCKNWLRRKSKFLQRKAIIRHIFGRLSDVGKNQSMVTYSTQNEGDIIYYIGYMNENGTCYTEIRYSNGYLDAGW